MPQKRKALRFNIKNLKYALPDGSGGHDSPQDLAYATSLTLEAEYEETRLYGDGQVISILGDDKGKTGEIGVTDIARHYEIDMGRNMEVDGGVADVQVRKSVEHAIYYEYNEIEDGQTRTVKVWMFGCTTGKASETYEQTEDDPNISTFAYPLNVLGTPLKDTDGIDEHTDENGNTVKVYRITSRPDDSDYATFGDSVPTPKLKA